MSYIGAQPSTAAFPFDQFSGNGSTTAFTLSYAPASTTSMVVCISGVVQNPTTYAITGLTLTFSQAPPTGTNNIGVLFLGLPASGVSTPGNTAYLSSTEFTATAGQTTFTPSGTYQVGFINVIRNGSQLAPADFTATNGTTVVLGTACAVGDSVVIQVYNLVSVTNALPLTGGTVTGATTFNAGVNLAVSSGNVGIGTSSPAASLSITKQTTALSGTSNPYGLYLYPTSSGQCWVDAITNSSSNTLVGLRSYNNGTYYTANLDASGNFQFNSGYGSTATAYGCRAWVNFNGTGTVAIRASGNVSSITDNGVGDYTVNFSTAMPDVNYSVAGTSGILPANTGWGTVVIRDGLAAPTTSTVRIGSIGYANWQDTTILNVQIFR